LPNHYHLLVELQDFKKLGGAHYVGSTAQRLVDGIWRMKLQGAKYGSTILIEPSAQRLITTPP
jgi:hypothetical protein